MPSEQSCPWVGPLSGDRQDPSQDRAAGESSPLAVPARLWDVVLGRAPSAGVGPCWSPVLRVPRQGWPGGLVPAASGCPGCSWNSLGPGTLTKGILGGILGPCLCTARSRFIGVRAVSSQHPLCAGSAQGRGQPRVVPSLSRSRLGFEPCFWRGWPQGSVVLGHLSCLSTPGRSRGRGLGDRLGTLVLHMDAPQSMQKSLARAGA